MSRMERSALEIQVSEFGQTPVQLFEESHMSRRIRILHLDMMASVDDKKMYSAKLITLTEEN